MVENLAGSVRAARANSGFVFLKKFGLDFQVMNKKDSINFLHFPTVVKDEDL